MEGFRIKFWELTSGGYGQTYRTAAYSEEVANTIVNINRELFHASEEDISKISIGEVPYVIVGPENNKGPERAER